MVIFKTPSRFEQHRPKGCLVLLLITAGASYKAAPDLASIPNTAPTPSPTLLVTCLGKETGLNLALESLNFTGVIPGNKCLA